MRMEALIKMPSRPIGLCTLLLFLVAFPSFVLAGAKEYPVEGTVTAVGVNREAAGDPVINSLHRTYTVKTPTRVFVLECPYWLTGVHLHSPKECGGSKTIGIGDAIRLRVEKTHAYLQTDTGKEQKLSILSEGINEGGVPEAAKR